MVAIGIHGFSHDIDYLSMIKSCPPDICASDYFGRIYLMYIVVLDLALLTLSRDIWLNVTMSAHER
jgi:hypothetical protein